MVLVFVSDFAMHLELILVYSIEKGFHCFFKLLTNYSNIINFELNGF